MGWPAPAPPAGAYAGYGAYHGGYGGGHGGAGSYAGNGKYTLRNEGKFKHYAHLHGKF